MKKYFLCLLCLFILTGCHFKNDLPISSKDETLSYQILQTYFSSFQCGDIINLENTHYLSNLVIPGRWKHMLIYIGTKQQAQQIIKPECIYYQKIMNRYHKNEVLVLDANSTGVKIREFKDMANLRYQSYLKAFACYRLKKDSKFIQIMIEHAMDYYNRPYDYEMNTNNDEALYCSELIYRALLQSGVKISKETQVFSYHVITPTDIIFDLKKQKLVDEINIFEVQNN